MLNNRQPPRPQYAYECGTLQQHFNHLRNNSLNMRSILSWGADEPSQVIHQHRTQPTEHQHNHKIDEDTTNKQKKAVTFDANQNVKNNANAKTNASLSQSKNFAATKASSTKAQQRPRSASTAKKGKQEQLDNQLRQRIRERERQQQAQRKQERRQKVKEYLDGLKPYTRSLTNTKYQDYFDKAALQSYGRANVKNAIGGIIYGNHQKTFNLNPHTKGNQPKYYQTHQTAINYGRRTKLNDQDKWSRLEKELTKKLGLKDKNETLKEGKEVVMVDVDDSNMYSVMKENLAFKKSHDAQIRKLQAEYKAEIQKEKKEAVQQFYANKKERILNGNTIDAQNSQYVCPRDERGRLQQQVIYRHTDKNGVVRIGGDRHALTCFVDMNFPENDAAYTQELINRMPIFPVEVQEKDKYIDDQKRQNHQKSLQNIYPSHYLLPNCDQPQVIKMINEKYGSIQKEKAVAQTKRLGSTFGTTRVNNSSLIPQ